MEYDRTEVIGTGGSATVYRAVHRHTGAVVALKIWDVPLDAYVLERFAREIRALRSMRLHANTARC